MRDLRNSKAMPGCQTTHQGEVALSGEGESDVLDQAEGDAVHLAEEAAYAPVVVEGELVAAVESAARLLVDVAVGK